MPCAVSPACSVEGRVTPTSLSADAPRSAWCRCRTRPTVERDWRRWPISARSVQNNQYRVLGLGTTVIPGGGTLSTGVRHGQPLYLANLYVFTKWFPWFVGRARLDQYLHSPCAGRTVGLPLQDPCSPRGDRGAIARPKLARKGRHGPLRTRRRRRCPALRGKSPPSSCDVASPCNKSNSSF